MQINLRLSFVEPLDPQDVDLFMSKFSEVLERELLEGELADYGEVDDFSVFGEAEA